MLQFINLSATSNSPICRQLNCWRILKLKIDPLSKTTLEEVVGLEGDFEATVSNRQTGQCRQLASNKMMSSLVLNTGTERSILSYLYSPTLLFVGPCICIKQDGSAFRPHQTAFGYLPHHRAKHVPQFLLPGKKFESFRRFLIVGWTNDRHYTGYLPVCIADGHLGIGRAWPESPSITP